MSSLDQLRQHTVVVADTGDIDAIAEHRPQDATTNPSLLWKAVQMPQYQSVVQQALQAGDPVAADGLSAVDAAIDRLAVHFGCRILQLIPGRVSTEVDAGLSFDQAGTVARARRLIALYAAEGIERERVLIKIASTWEGIQAARELEQDGIHCNLTLLFGFGQAVACADANVTLISPFVGRIYDWHKQHRGVDHIPPEEDPGVASVTRIYNYYRKHGIRTEVMGASFRTADQIRHLCGCDLLTISPALLSELAESSEDTTVRLSESAAQTMDLPAVSLNEAEFRWMLNEDEMASQKLAEGIRGFAADLNRLRDWIDAR